MWRTRAKPASAAEVETYVRYTRQDRPPSSETQVTALSALVPVHPKTMILGQ
jgi:hypothetical protein